MSRVRRLGNRVTRTLGVRIPSGPPKERVAMYFDEAELKEIRDTVKAALEAEAIESRAFAMQRDPVKTEWVRINCQNKEAAEVALKCRPRLVAHLLQGIDYLQSENEFLRRALLANDKGNR